MGKSYRTQKAVTAILSLAFLAPALMAADVDPLKMVPADSLFCVRINNPDYVFSQIDLFLGGISPMPALAQTGFRTQIARLSGNPSMAGLNMTGSFVIYGRLGENESYDELLNVIIPVSDYAAFISSSTNLSPADANGISKMNDGLGLITRVAGVALFKPTQNYEKFLTLKKSVIAADFKSLASTLESAQAAQSASAPVWAWCNIPQINKSFGPQVTSAIDEIARSVEQMPAGAGAAPGGKMASDMFKTEAEIFKGLLSQSKSVTFTVIPKPAVLSIACTTSALPATKMAELLTAEPSAKGKNKLAYLLNDGAMMNLSGTFSAKLHSEAMKFFVYVFCKSMKPETAVKMQTFASDASAVLKGNLAMSISIDPNGKPPFNGLCAVEITDKNLFNKLIDEGVEMSNSGVMSDIYKPMGIAIEGSTTIKRDIENYKGVSISSATLKIKAMDTNSPEGQRMKHLYGDQFVYYWASVDNLCLYSVGDNTGSQLKKAIDLAKAGSTASVCPEFRQAMTLLSSPDKADIVMTFNILRALKIGQSFMPFPVMPNMNFATSSNIVLAAGIDNGSLTLELAIPKTHLMEVVQAVTAIAQSMSAQTAPMSVWPPPVKN